MGELWQTFRETFPNLGWSDLELGLERAIVEPNSVVLWAGDYLLTHPEEECESLLQLATASPTELDVIKTNLRTLARSETEELKHRALRRWRYVFLRRLTPNSHDLPILIEGVYSDFDYLEDMAHLVYYMPVPATQRSSKDRCETDLWENLRIFLAKEHAVLS